MSFLTVSWIFLPAAIISTILTGAIRRYALHTNLMDIPNRRSSHANPTPRGGGLGLVVVFLIMVIFGMLGSRISWMTGMSLLGGLPIAIVGFWDDHRSLKVSTRIVVHFICAFWLVFLVKGVPVCDLGCLRVDWGNLGYLIAVPATVWFINLYNFMDGIDGMAGGEAVSIPAIAAAFFTWQGRADLVWLSLALSAGSLGFLVWNWPPAKIFMGDIGSGFLGFVFSALVLLSGAQDPKLVWFWIILLGVFIVDTTMTLLRRMARGERWYQPHRSHAYQWAARKWGHKSVSSLVILINLVWLTPLAVISQIMPTLIPAMLVIAYAPLIWSAWALGAGKADPYSIPRSR